MEDKEYLVRGALLRCSKGSHPRRLNLPTSHGVYSKEHPIIRKNDYKEENISHFGVCQSSTPPEGAEIVRYKGYVPPGSTETAEEVQGKQCIPNLTGEWSTVNGQAVTMDSYLVCNCMGTIEPLTFGQEYED